MVLGPLLGDPDGELVPHGPLRHLILGQGLYDLVVYQQPVDVLDLLARRIGRLELDDPAFLAYRMPA